MSIISCSSSPVLLKRLYLNKTNKTKFFSLSYVKLLNLIGSFHTLEISERIISSWTSIARLLTENIEPTVLFFRGILYLTYSSFSIECVKILLLCDNKRKEKVYAFYFLLLSNTHLLLLLFYTILKLYTYIYSLYI